MKLMQYSIDSDGIGHLVFDNPDEKMNSLSRQFMDEFMAVLDQIESESGVHGVVLESAKPGVFFAGADIKWLKELDSLEACRAFARTAHTPFDRLEQLKVPTLAAINGICLGGGLELALACKWRVAVDHRAVQIGLPEVKLGVIPGCGGTQRLPALVGIQNALQMAATGKSLKVHEALQIGVIDAVLPAENFAVDAKTFLMDKIAAGAAVERSWLSAEFRYGTAEDEENPDAQMKIFGMARQMALKQTKGHMQAPLKVIDAIEAGATGGFAAGLAAEAKIFGDILWSNEARSLIDLFVMQSDIRRVSGAEDRFIKPADIKKVGVLGAGLMGSGIAHSAVAAGYRVVLKDISEEALAKGVNSIRKIFAKAVEKGKMTDETMQKTLSLLETSTDYASFSDADIVIEAVFEDVNIKQTVIREIEEHTPEYCIFASNTSSIAITELAKVSKHPENFIGMHYFSPVDRMPLLEIIRGDITSDQTMVAAVAFAHKTRKMPIIVNDCYGFYTTRSVAAYLREALQCLNDGATVEDIDGAMADFGMPVGPITLLDEVGHDVGEHVLIIMNNAYPERFSDNLTRVTVNDNRYGRKNQRGFYLYEGGRKNGVDESVYALFTERKDATLSREDIQERIVMSLINEVGFCMGENIVTNYNDAEIGLIFGIGFPPFRGGPLHYVDFYGIGNLVDTLRKLERAWGKRFSPAPFWSVARDEGKTFFK